MNVPSLTSSSFTDDLADLASTAVEPVVAAASAVSAEATDLAGSVAGTVAKGAVAKRVVTDGVPAAWELARRHPRIATASVVATAVGLAAWRRRSGGEDTVTTTNRPTPVVSAA